MSVALAPARRRHVTSGSARGVHRRRSRSLATWPCTPSCGVEGRAQRHPRAQAQRRQRRVGGRDARDRHRVGPRRLSRPLTSRPSVMGSRRRQGHLVAIDVIGRRRRSAVSMTGRRGIEPDRAAVTVTVHGLLASGSARWPCTSRRSARVKVGASVMSPGSAPRALHGNWPTPHGGPTQSQEEQAPQHDGEPEQWPSRMREPP